MDQYYGVVRSDEYLEHFGIKGQKWGIRKYQNPDGTLTEEGKQRYGKSAGSIQKGLNKLDKSKANYIRDKRGYSRNPDYGSDYGDKKIKDTNKAVNQLLNIAKDKGYNVSTTQKSRSTDRGERFCSAFLFGAPGLVTAHLVSKHLYARISGTQYKVSDPSKKKK